MVQCHPTNWPPSSLLWNYKHTKSTLPLLRKMRVHCICTLARLLTPSGSPLATCVEWVRLWIQLSTQNNMTVTLQNRMGSWNQTFSHYNRAMATRSLGTRRKWTSKIEINQPTSLTHYPNVHCKTHIVNETR